MRYVLVRTVNDSERDLREIACLVAPPDGRVRAGILPSTRMEVVKRK